MFSLDISSVLFRAVVVLTALWKWFQLTRARSGGLLRNLVSSIRDQRSASTSTDQLQTASALDTDSRKDQREEATQGVLGDRSFAGKIYDTTMHRPVHGCILDMFSALLLQLGCVFPFGKLLLIFSRCSVFQLRLHPQALSWALSAGQSGQL